jgi:hypothetical protein
VTDFWREFVTTTVRGMGDRLAAVLPGLLAMFLLLAAGALVGWLVRFLVIKLLNALDLDRRARSWGLVSGLGRAEITRSPAHLLGALAFWGVFAVFATMGIDALALPKTPSVTEMLIGLLLRILAATLILAVGWLGANFVGQAVLLAAVNARLREARFLARGARWAVLLFTIATALTQLGIGKEMVMTAFGITFGGLILALALAFGLGGRRLARELLERWVRGKRESHPSETTTHV